MENNEEQSQHETRPDVESIKNRAVEALGPLVEQLDAAPERKFEIFMMALRASSSTPLLAGALAMAEQISDPSAKAEALIDVINEASYLLKEAA